MKIVQTFWCATMYKESPLRMKAGWLHPEYNWMSWALSCLLLRRQYDNVELYTDELGKQILIDTLHLPYTDVHVVFDDSFKIHPKLFALAKIKTYSLQEEPFVHIDGDIFLWKPLPDTLLESELIVSNLEVDLFFNKEILGEMEKNFDYIPKHLKGVHDQRSILASNAGIMGGSNIAFIKKYCKEAVDIITLNEEKLEVVSTGGLNWLIEQISLFYLSRQEGVTIDYYMPTPVTHPLYQDYWRFADIPQVEMIHPVGGCKKEPYVLYHLVQRLRLEFPEMYYKILGLCKNEGILLRNRLYQYIDLNDLGTNRALRNPSHFKTKLDPSILDSAKTDFNRLFKRTLLTIDYFFSRTIYGLKELSIFFKNDDIPEQIQEIYTIELKSYELLEDLFPKIKKGEIYGREMIHYEKTANFFPGPDWIKKKVGIKSGVEVLDIDWNWNLNGHENDTIEEIGKIFTTTKKNLLVTLNENLLTLEIFETYHEGIDAVILRLTRTPKTISNLLTEIKAYFEDNISEDNPQYQRLIFDTIKRLAFANLLFIS